MIYSVLVPVCIYYLKTAWFYNSFKNNVALAQWNRMEDSKINPKQDRLDGDATRELMRCLINIPINIPAIKSFQ